MLSDSTVGGAGAAGAGAGAGAAAGVVEPVACAFAWIAPEAQYSATNDPSRDGRETFDHKLFRVKLNWDWCYRTDFVLALLLLLEASSMTNRNGVGPFAAGLVCFHQLSTGTKANTSRRRAAPCRIRPPPRVRGASTGCFRLTSSSLARKGASTGVAFCSGRTLPAMAARQPSLKEVAEVDRPVCCAAQTVHVTVNATAQPVHFLLRSGVALGFAQLHGQGLSTHYAKGFCAKLRPDAQQKRRFFANCHNGVGR